MMGFDLHIGDSIICRKENPYRKTVKIKKEGNLLIWAKTEVTEELPVTIKTGNEYYIRCSASLGFFIGHPKLELVDNDLGRLEYESLKLDFYELTDKLILNDGKVIECKIEKEDTDIIYISLLKKNEEIKQQVNRKDIKEIKKVE